ncbi:clasp N terminal-domain-containing protein [Desarmillaria tabescens]|uniref:Clasp N terminal-domain-containing protein n=1 Tax=Armillaria tabescens TaxID=1929756 RepID=A0AA39N9C3_ARMTA|nr:clasp N terminal-domain-containing protein [Desarmillaria tabescens]KAK0461420.1 clasp N terminal-domain-containing protein [Desarmillaria tabescens]
MARQVLSANDVKLRIEALVPRLTLIETEESWDTIATSITTLTQVCKDGSCEYTEVIVSSVRSLSNPITSAIKSERTRLSGVAIDCITELATGLGTSFEPLLPVFFPALLSLCARTNKVFVTRARACILVIIESTQLPSILPYFAHSIKDKSMSLRLAAAEGVLTYMNCLNPPDLEKEVRAREIENLIKATTRDANADVRKTGRKVFDAFKVLLPDRVDNFVAPLTPTIKKYLNIAPKKGLPPLPPLQASTSNSTKSHLSRSVPAPPSSSAAVTLPSKSTASRPAPVLTHSTSSSRASSRSRTAPEGPKPTAVSGPKKGTMPPPDTIPTRPTQPLRHPGPPLKSSSASSASNDKRPTPPLRPGMPAFRSATNLRSAPVPAHSDSAVARGPRRELVPSQHAPVPSSRAQRAPLPPPSKVRNDESDNSRSTKSIQPVQQSTTVQATCPASSNGRPKIVIGQKPELPQLSTKPSYADNKVKAKPLMKPVAKAEASASSKRPPVAQKKPEKAAAKPMWGSRPAKPPVPKHPPRSRSVPARSRTTTASSSKTEPSSLKGTTEETSNESAKDVESNEQADAEGAGVAVDDTAERVQESEDHASEQQPAPSISSSHDEETPEGEGGAADSSDETVRVEEATDTPNNAPQQVIIAKPLSFPVDAPATPPSSQGENIAKPQKTPISALLSSIEQGFLFTPASPLSPPISYLSYPRGMNDATNLAAPFPLQPKMLFGISTDSGSEKFVQPWPIDRQRLVAAEGENGCR